MNIDQFREEQARINQELEVETNAQAEPSTTTAVEEIVQETQQTDTVSVPQGTEVQTQEVATKVEVPQVEVQQLQAEIAKMNESLKQAQEAKVWFDKINANPEYAKAFAEDNGLTYIDPNQRAVQEVQARYQELLLEKEIGLLQVKYADFDPKAVIQTAVDKGINNLEDAYLLTKVQNPAQATLDPIALKEQIRQEVLNELQSNVSTTSMIGAGGASSKQVTPTAIELSPTELKVAQGMGLSPAEYHKWKKAK